MSINITMDQAFEFLERAVQEKGDDYTYPSAERKGGTCQYFNRTTGSPSCIVGHVLAYAGITAAQLKEEYEGLSIKGLLTEMEGVVTMDEPTSTMLRLAQRRQDNNQTWGLALDTARRHKDGILITV